MLKNGNKEIYDALSEVVCGHDHAKKVLINVINRSKFRHYQKWGLLENDDKLMKLSNCLLIGDSGTGKTLLVETLSKIMKVPYLKIDATELNPTGASGGLKQKNVVELITDAAKEFLSRQDGSWSLNSVLDQAIVFVDEIDKLGNKCSDSWNAHVQANFLTMFENKGKLNGITYIFAGAFCGLNKYDEKIKSIGFSYSVDSKTTKKDLSQEIIKFGIIPELVGRMENIVLLDNLRIEDYKKILMLQIIPRANRRLRLCRLKELSPTEDELDGISSDAHKSGLGVRALEISINNLLVDIEFNL